MLLKEAESQKLILENYFDVLNDAANDLWIKSFAFEHRPDLREFALSSFTLTNVQIYNLVEQFDIDFANTEQTHLSVDHLRVISLYYGLDDGQKKSLQKISDQLSLPLSVIRRYRSQSLKSLRDYIEKHGNF